MTDYYYTKEDRIRQLACLVVLLLPLIECMRRMPQVASLAPQYEEAREKAQALLSDGFTQEQLSELARAVPDIFHRHKEWIPPLVRREDGSWVEEEWFTELDAVLRPALHAAQTLRYLGY